MRVRAWRRRSSMSREPMRRARRGARERPEAESRRRCAQTASRDRDLVVLLEDIQDPRNLGALLRVCEGAGVGRVLIRDRGAAPLTPTVVAASAGATEWLEVERVTNTAAELERFKESGFWIYGAAEGGESPWADRPHRARRAVLRWGREGASTPDPRALRPPGRAAHARAGAVAQRGDGGGGAAVRGGPPAPDTSGTLRLRLAVPAGIAQR